MATTPMLLSLLAAFGCNAKSDVRLSIPAQSPLPPGLHGLAGSYTDPSALTKLEFGSRSHWMQPWRAFLETVPAHQFLDGIGVGFPNTQSDLEPELVAQMLSKNGFRTVRVEIGWGEINFEDEQKLNRAERLTEVIGALRRWKLRPLILLNLHQGVPGPIKMFVRNVIKDAPKGATQVQLDSVDGLVIGRSGFSDLTDYWAAEALVTAIDGQTVTLSKPLPKALTAGTKAKMATLKYRPFSRPDSADYLETMQGWKRYVGAVSDFVAGQMGTVGSQDLGFDLEVYNELTFGDRFLSINNYYEPKLEDYEEDSIWDNLIGVTAGYVDQNPARFAGVGLTNGFSNTIPWTASAQQPARVSAINKHPYKGVGRYPADEQGGTRLGQTGQATQAVPSYTALFPEYYGTGTQTETLLRDSAPLNTEIYGKVHGRYGRGRDQPVGVWITEVAIQPTEVGVSDPAAARALKAKSAARYFSFYLNKGVNKLHLYTAADGDDTGYSILQDNFVRYASTATTYPADDAPYTSPALQVTRRITDTFKVGLDSQLGQTRSLEVRSVRDAHDHAQFAAVGDQPPLYNREVLAVLPYQVNAKRFVIAYYVMTRDVRQTLEPEQYVVELGGLRASGAKLSAYDPFTDKAVPLESHPSERQDSLTLSLSTTDYPRLLIVEEP
jgi:hypothetical protein